MNRAVTSLSVARQCLVHVLFAVPLLLLQAPANGATDATDAARANAIEGAFLAFEEAVPEFRNDAERAFYDTALDPVEQVRYLDRHKRKLFAMAVALINEFPGDERTLDILRVCFSAYMPRFLVQDAPLPPRLLRDYKSTHVATGEQARKRTENMLRAMPCDLMYKEVWLQQGAALVARIQAVPGASEETIETAAFYLFVRDVQLVSQQERLYPVDWSELFEPFAAHVRKYISLGNMGLRAEDFLARVRIASPQLARAGWNYLLEQGLGEGSAAGAVAIRNSAETALQSIATQMSGDLLEAVKFTALDGSAIDVMAMRGKVVLLDFWGTWCGPCVAQMPGLKALQEKYGDRGFQIIGIACDSVPEQKLRSFLQDGGYDWPQHYDGQGRNNYFAQLFGIESYPTTYLLDRNGRIVEQDLTGTQLEEAVRRYLNLE